MYHTVIHINFTHYYSIDDVNFDFSFFISKNKEDKFSPIKYGELLDKFSNIGFDIKYLKFYDIYDLDTLVYCNYNYQPNFNIFFSAYDKVIKDKKFDISFEYGVIINGKFILNNINYFSGIYFVHNSTRGYSHLPVETIIIGKQHAKHIEYYQISDTNGIIISKEKAVVDTNFEQHFFEKYEVKVYLRKYKLSRLKEKMEN